MNENNSTEFGPTGLGIEYLLENVRFEPRSAFTVNLNARLRQKVASSFADQSPVNIRPPIWKKRLTWRWAVSAVVFTCLALATLWITVPPVRAQVAAMFQRFGVRLSFVQEGVVVSAFRPLTVEGIPPQLTHFVAHNWCFGALQDGQVCEGLSYTELRYFSQDTFVVIYEAPVQPANTLPPGDQIRIGEQAAVLHRNLSGVVRLAEPAPQTWRVNGGLSSGGGGGGGGGGGSNETGPRNLSYSGAVELIWHQSGVHVELLTNLPLNEAQRLAESMKPAPALREP